MAQGSIQVRVRKIGKPLSQRFRAGEVVEVLVGNQREKRPALVLRTGDILAGVGVITGIKRHALVPAI